MKTLTIYYIATNAYKDGFRHFMKNIHLFFPHFKKEVVILSDGLQELNGTEVNGVNYKTFYISHFCWPIVALFKCKYILDHFSDSDFICYFNANLQANPDFKNWDMFEFDKMNLSYHAMNGNVDNFIMMPLAKDNANSRSYIGNIKYEYIQSAFLFGPNKIFKKMCEDVVKMTEYDLRNNIIPKWHDESYINKWTLTNSDLVIKKQFMTHKKFSNECPTCIIETIKKPRKII